MATMGRQRLARRIPRDKWADVMRTARNWWLVDAPNVKAARQLCALWPERTTIEIDGIICRILNHGRGG